MLEINGPAILRKMCCDFMSINSQYFQPFFVCDIQSHLREMRQNGTWGDHPELIALCHVSRVNAFIFRCDGAHNEVSLFEDDATPCLLLMYDNSHYSSILSSRPMSLHELRCRNSRQEFQGNFIVELQKTPQKEPSKENGALINLEAESEVSKNAPGSRTSSEGRQEREKLLAEEFKDILGEPVVENPQNNDESIRPQEKRQLSLFLKMALILFDENQEEKESSPNSTRTTSKAYEDKKTSEVDALILLFFFMSSSIETQVAKTHSTHKHHQIYKIQIQ